MEINRCWLVRSNYSKQQGKAKSSLSCTFKPEYRLSGKNSDEISNALKSEGLMGVNLSIAVSIADLFVNSIQLDDMLLVANKQTPDIISIVKVVGNYNFDVEKAVHFRDVVFLHEIPRASLPKHFRDTVLRTPRIVAKVTLDEVVKSLLDKSVLYKPAALAVKFPLRPDFSIDFTIPSNITKKETERFSDFVKTLFQQEG